MHTSSQEPKHVTFACLFINKRVGNNKLLLHVELYDLHPSDAFEFQILA